MNGLAAQPRELRSHQQRAAARFGMQGGDMAKVAFGFIELLLAFDNLFVPIYNITNTLSTKRKLLE